MTHVSAKAGLFTESVIREMTRLAIRHGAINLAQGFPDFPAPQEIKDAACAAIAGGRQPVRDHLGSASACATRSPRRASVTTAFPVDPETRGLRHLRGDRGDVLVDPRARRSRRRGRRLRALLRELRPRRDPCGGVPALRAPARAGLDVRPPTSSRARWTDARAIIINTPNNPTGKVFSREELREIAGSVPEARRRRDHRRDLRAPRLRRRRATCRWPRFRECAERTVTINALSKTYSVTGWRVGWAIAPPPLTDAIRKVHDFVSVGAAAPLQEAGAAALALPDAYYTEIGRDYASRRGTMLATARGRGLPLLPAEGRVLHPDGHLRLRIPRRRGLRALARVGGEGGRRPGLVVLREARGRSRSPALLVLQEAGDPEQPPPSVCRS